MKAVQTIATISLIALVLYTSLNVPTFGEGIPAREPFENRQKMFFDAVWADYREHAVGQSARNAFWRAEALFQCGHVEEGRRLVHRGLDQLVPGNRENRWIHGGNSGFTVWPGLDCYIRYEKFLDQAIRDRYRTIYTGAVFYRRLTTSNHKIMAAVTRYLATQIWGADAFHPGPFFEGREDDGAVFEKNDPTGEKYVRQIIAETVTTGPGEYASRPYGAENVLPLLTLAECARDAEIRHRAALAYEYSLLELAPAWLGGHLATFSPRSYPDMETQRPWGIAALAWVYFGGIPPDHLQDQWALRAATSKYRVPFAVEVAGQDRSAAYVHRALIDRWALYHYVNRSYVLFSRSPKAATGQFMGQSYPCGLMWAEPDTAKGSHLWITSPAADDNSIEGNKPTGIHTHGVTKFEQELQHKDALLFVFDIPATYRNPYALGYIPGGYKAVYSGERQIFLHFGSVLAAITSTQPIAWNEKAGIRAPAGKPHEGDSEFRVMARQAVVVIETASRDEFPGKRPGAPPYAQLGLFRAKVLARSRIALEQGKRPVGRYTDRSGNKLECEFDGEDRINGRPVDYAHWPALENPWMSQSLPGGPLTITGTLSRRYDFEKWTVTEVYNAPPH
jgi:hypothetical protein